LLATVRGRGVPRKLSDDNVRLIEELLEAAVAAAGVREAPPGGGKPSLAKIAKDTVACVANVDLPDDERELERMLVEQGWTDTTLVANDTYAVLRAGLDDEPAAGADRRWGVGVTCGAGINCAGMAPDGRTAGYLALGTISGDWGGGGSLGLEAQWWAIRDEDGRGPRTSLRHLVPAHFGLAEPTDLVVALHRGQVRFDRIGELAPLVFEAADAGDAVARDLVHRLATEISLMAGAVIRRLGLTNTAVPVILGGGVLAARNPLLIDSITEQIGAVAPASTVRVIEAAPVAGAALLGLDRIGAPVSAMRRLREEFARQLDPPMAAPEPAGPAVTSAK
jgi:N-acetylglucosamine kinase-like BadF-type ATPase